MRLTSTLKNNWDLAVTSSALLVIVGGMAAPHVWRLLPERTPERRAPGYFAR